MFSSIFCNLKYTAVCAFDVETLGPLKRAEVFIVCFVRFILVFHGASGTKTECETSSVNNTSTSSALKKVSLLCP